MATFTTSNSCRLTTCQVVLEGDGNGDLLSPGYNASELVKKERKPNSSFGSSSFIRITFVDQCSSKKPKGRNDTLISGGLGDIAYLQGTNDLLFGDLVSLVFEDPTCHNKLSVVWISVFGEYHFNQVTIDSRSRFFPACQNLSPDSKASNVRKALAVTSLRAFNSLSVNCLTRVMTSMHASTKSLHNWDETNAGELASNMHLIDTKTPSEVGSRLLQLGYLQNYYINSIDVDVVYSSKDSLLELNDKVVSQLGDQVHYMWNPSSEYYLEHMSHVYVPPIDSHAKTGTISSEIKQLLHTQSCITKSLVNLLQDFIIPLRARIVDRGFKSITLKKVNTVFPPTLDEVARACRIWLEALQEAAPFGPLEILKACAQVIPYFYKALTRHKAACRNLNYNLYTFFRKLEEEHFEVPKKYCNLDKLIPLIQIWCKTALMKLPVTRLYEHCVQSSVQSNIQLGDKYYHFVLRTIESALAFQCKNDSMRVSLNDRITNWSNDLHNHLLESDVVSVYHLEDLCNLNQWRSHQVLIVFTDLVLFLSIEDDDYYHDILFNNDDCQLCVGDVILDVLQNGAPCKLLPLLRLVGWCSVGSVMPLCYGSDFKYLKLCFNYSDTAPKPNLPFSVRYYKILEPSVSGPSIVDTMFKCKISSKTQPFHLFKDQESSFRDPFSIYSVTQCIENYELEANKSPFAIVLNMDYDEAFLFKYDLFCGFFVSTIGDEIHVVGASIQGEIFKVSLRPEQLITAISKKLKEWVPHMFSKDSYQLWKNDLDGNKARLQAFKYWLNFDSTAEKAKLLAQYQENKLLPTFLEFVEEQCYDDRRRVTSSKSSFTCRATNDVDLPQSKSLLTDLRQKVDQNSQVDKCSKDSKMALHGMSSGSTSYHRLRRKSVNHKEDINSMSTKLVRNVKGSNSHLEFPLLDFDLMRRISKSENLMTLAAYYQVETQLKESNWKSVYYKKGFVSSKESPPPPPEVRYHPVKGRHAISGQFLLKRDSLRVVSDGPSQFSTCNSNDSSPAFRNELEIELFANDRFTERFQLKW
ncbi:Protein involved in bud-site selection and required for axial budding pattern [Komagataella phaffii GS115]|uniref:Protein involved in bud-site selection and required for axial budding pattern n=1 Tax=Komagataella phaffii (strain GS115 / ATCC 20864) TaxID=644223 RepID=C4QX55_KOMPG|nr:Protein involved in bud-site selection and required for axial budding pattern [Komagataella phaffii GS115]CAY67828.1 Protein involved in bud-site selection and required for axial budding pattern [Komagataella phaffii GS115]